MIPAAGAGVRMGQGRAKQFLDFFGRPMIAVTLEVFQQCPSVDAVILVVPSESVEECRKSIVEAFGFTKVRKVVEGGSRRQDSVRRGIAATGGEFERILIHDGVRPLVRAGLIEKIVALGSMERAVITALPAKETVKEVTDEGFVEKTHDRRRIWLVQTPQIFLYEDILEAHNRALREGWKDVTDDALLAERMGIPVKVIQGSEENIKVTTPQDMALAQVLWRKDGFADRHERK